MNSKRQVFENWFAKKFPNEGEYIEVEIEACNEETALKNAIKEKMKSFEKQLIVLFYKNHFFRLVILGSLVINRFHHTGPKRVIFQIQQAHH